MYRVFCFIVPGRIMTRLYGVNFENMINVCMFFSRILKALLNELVEKSVLGKHPKLMLRRYVICSTIHVLADIGLTLIN